MPLSRDDKLMLQLLNSGKDLKFCKDGSVKVRVGWSSGRGVTWHLLYSAKQAIAASSRLGDDA